MAGKTGTSDESNDAWFVGFTNEVTVAVWVGYDNAAGKRRTLGGGATGGSIAVPIFEPIIQAVWANNSPKTALAPPSPEAKRQLVVQGGRCRAGRAGQRDGAPEGPVECFRIDRTGQIIDTQYQLVSREETYAERDQGYYASNPFGFIQQFMRPQYYYEQRRDSGNNYYYNNGRGYVPVPRESGAAACAVLRSEPA